MSSPSLRVLVVALSARTGGGGTHLLNQMAELARAPGLDVTVWASRETADWLAKATQGRVVKRNSSSLPSRLITEQLRGAWEARRHDVVYMPGNFALFASPRPQVLTLQNAWLFTDAIRRFRAAHCRRSMRARLVVESAVARASIRRATVVLVVSQTMRDMVEADLGRVAKIVVLPAATPEHRSAGALPAGLEPSGYALVVAHDDPHKEWDRLIETFASDSRLPPLVVVGKPRRRRPWWEDRRVRILGAVSDPGTLAALYQSAVCCVAHSRFESFGLTPLEALRSGTPVVAADIPAHREVCGDAVSYYPADDLKAMADAVVAVQESSSRSIRRPVRSQTTWKENARTLADILRAAAQG